MPVRLTKENYHVTSFDWSPDGKSIVFGHTKRPGTAYSNTSNISAIEIASGKVSEIAATELPEVVPSFTPDGKHVSFISGKDPLSSMTNEYMLKLAPVNGGAVKTFPIDLDGRTAVFPGWASDGKFYYTEARGTIAQLFALDPATGKLTAIPSTGVTTGISLNAMGNIFAMVKQDWNKAPEIFVADIARFNPVQLTNMNDEQNRLPLGKTEVIRWKSGDGKEIEGLLTYPVGYKAFAADDPWWPQRSFSANLYWRHYR
jgi:dipeptidyl aminopeptidase/acylaminoacyl peptidase